MEGGCDCGKVRYRLLDQPFVVHCCHCHWSQRETGTAFALNALIEADRVELLGDAAVSRKLPSESGRGQMIFHCPECLVTVWSHYPQAGDTVNFIRTGTLDKTDSCAPSVHIYTDSKQPWVVLPDSAEKYPDFYSSRDIPRLYGEAGAARFMAMRK